MKIHVTDEMEKDLRECWRMSALLRDGKDCDQCSWDRVRWLGTGFCELMAVQQEELLKEAGAYADTPTLWAAT